jgi:hypothetical protein
MTTRAEFIQLIEAKIQELKPKIEVYDYKRERNITQFADAGGGNVRVTSASHGFDNGNDITISDTTNYNGAFVVANRTADTFTIIDTWVADDATGTVTYSITRGLSSINLIDTLIDLSLDEVSQIVANSGDGNTKMETITGNGTIIYELEALLTDWDEIASEIDWIVFPYDPAEANSDTPILKTSYKDWTVNWRLNGSGDKKKHLVFRGNSGGSFSGNAGTIPDAGELILVFYTAKEEVPASGPISISDKHVNAWAALIAGRYIRQHMASEYLQNVGNVNIQIADGIFQSPSAAILAHGQALINDFYIHFGIDPTDPTAIKDGSGFRQFVGDGTTRNYWYVNENTGKG